MTTPTSDSYTETRKRLAHALIYNETPTIMRELGTLVTMTALWHSLATDFGAHADAAAYHHGKAEGWHQALADAWPDVRHYIETIITTATPKETTDD